LSIRRSCDGIYLIERLKRRFKTMRRCLELAGVLLIAVVLMTGCGSQPSGPSMTFETIGTKGAIVFVTLVSPSPDAVSAEDLANRLREDWQNKLVGGNMIEVMVFDNKEAPQRWLELWPIISSLSDQEWADEQSQIFPHWIASYWRNKTSGLHQVEIQSRDADGHIVRTIKF